ncbi:predicted protein [Histoplasma capsulatum G186AR]|uniref:Uncharacterized protein n=1 Tax=Ajellomyces capsulatus (strain G186AR / H82 / ATCC MYA-2454 / RMSCC 2432) TaxID=447093 RepID=C0NPX1_AJECG|nr:uncharacterized protein HCBG_05201 [Histoplasma capsulatum G186AR]EEH06981.1 predicted protein [Histoplasma capsulatum G186AR]
MPGPCIHLRALSILHTIAEIGIAMLFSGAARISGKGKRRYDFHSHYFMGDESIRRNRTNGFPACPTCTVTSVNRRKFVKPGGILPKSFNQIYPDVAYSASCL